MTKALVASFRGYSQLAQAGAKHHLNGSRKCDSSGWAKEAPTMDVGVETPTARLPPTVCGCVKGNLLESDAGV